MYNTFNPPVISAQRDSTPKASSLLQARRASEFHEPDWSLLREADFSGTLVDWFGVTANRRSDDVRCHAALDLERALAYAG